MKKQKLKLSELRVKSFTIFPEQLSAFKGGAADKKTDIKNCPIGITTETSYSNDHACTNPHVCKEESIVLCEM